MGLKNFPSSLGPGGALKGPGPRPFDAQGPGGPLILLTGLIKQLFFKVPWGTARSGGSCGREAPAASEASRYERSEEPVPAARD